MRNLCVLCAFALNFNMATREQSLVNQYQVNRAMTAGKVQSVLLLVQKALSLTCKIDFSKPEESEELILKCQNIVAQLEMALNYRYGESVPTLFALYEQVYDALEARTERSIEVAQYLLGHYQETLELLRKRR
ncbi:MAG: flagellar protein FliS [Fibrobacteria bacterium]|nr:flagellar protein FliS [Fibrobacteria bacterium]